MLFADVSHELTVLFHACLLPWLFMPMLLGVRPRALGNVHERAEHETSKKW